MTMESPVPLAVYVRKTKRSRTADHEQHPPSSSTSKCSTPTKACLKKNPISTSAVEEVDNRGSHYCPTFHNGEPLSSRFEPVTPSGKRRKKSDVQKVVNGFFDEQNQQNNGRQMKQQQQAERPDTHVFRWPRACHIKKTTGDKFVREEDESSDKSRGPLKGKNAQVLLLKNDTTTVPIKKRSQPKAKICKLLTEVNEEKWQEQQRIFHERVGSFILCLNRIQGNRRFTEWKGSVVDSVIGAFLTQNVSDHISSSAFISLAARFPHHLTSDNRARNEKMSIETRSGRDRTDLKTTEGKGSSSGSNSEAKYLMSRGQSHNSDKGFNETTTMDTSKVKKIEIKKAKVKTLKGKKVKVNPRRVPKANFGHWEHLRNQAINGKASKEERSKDMKASSLDHEALRCAKVSEIAAAIVGRGQHNNMAKRIKDFLNQTVKNHESLDLEWLRDIPPDEAKEYLMNIFGLGLKSAECIRLLTLHQAAFPVDTNVGRIAVRLGWVPIQPRSEDDLLHRVDLSPKQKPIQEYLWPLLCNLDQATLYELHYQMITFGKVFCTKKRPNCNACPMSGECKHYASELASKMPTLPGTEETNLVTETISGTSEPIIEEPETPKNRMELLVPDIEDAFYEEEPDEIPPISLNLEKFPSDDDMSTALVTITPEAESNPTRKQKNVTRFRTEQYVYELPYNHPLLDRLDKRLPDDPCPYLLVIWEPGKTEEATPPSEKCCSLIESGKLCKEADLVQGTLLVPIRTTMRGCFPLNGTYFQVNEVFADHESSLHPILVQRGLIGNLPRKIVYFGISVNSIYKGLSQEEIRRSFHEGYICLRGFDRKTRAPRSLAPIFHTRNNQKVQKQRVSED